MSLNNFDKISSIYDRVAKLVFGQSIVEAQEFFLKKIPDHSKILVLGGGTGWILAKMLKAQPQCEIWYIEASLKMISLSETKSKKDKRIHFIHGTEEQIPDIKYDTVITNFYLDLFDDYSIKSVVDRINSALKPESIWIVTDFINQRWWHSLMLRIMYLFFKITSGVKVDRLPAWEAAMNDAGFKKKDSKLFYRNFIETGLFQS